jgi:hypothetical protein
MKKCDFRQPQIARPECIEGGIGCRPAAFAVIQIANAAE